MAVQDKAGDPDPSYDIFFHGSFDDSSLDNMAPVDGTSWDLGDSDSSSDPTGLSGLDSFLLSSAVTPFHVAELPSQESTTSVASNTLECSDLLSQSSQFDWGIKQEDSAAGPGSDADGQRQRSLKHGQGPSLQPSQLPSPPSPVLIPDTPFPSISDIELLNLEGIMPQTPSRRFTRPSPTSPTRRTRSSDAFQTFPSSVETDPDSQWSRQLTAEDTSLGVVNSMFVTPRARSRSSVLPYRTSQRTSSMPHFVSNTVETPFHNPNTAPMPPPRGPMTIPKPRISNAPEGVMGYRSRQLDTRKAITGTSPPSRVPSLAVYGEDISWTPPAFSPPIISVEGQDESWNMQDEYMEGEPLVWPSAAVQDATMSLARFTEGLEDFGYDDYTQTQAPDGLLPGISFNQSRSRSRQTATVTEPSFSLLSPPRSESVPSTPARRPPRTPPSSAQAMTPRTSPLRRMHSARGVSTSPSPARGRPRLGEPLATRSLSSAAADRILRKQRSSSRRELRENLAPDGAGFVNYTPHDGQVLMDGVAPSGSSKTKAKREREESDRRRKLGHAALKAVEAAGGDVDMLAEEARYLMDGYEME